MTQLPGLGFVPIHPDLTARLEAEDEARYQLGLPGSENVERLAGLILDYTQSDISDARAAVRIILRELMGKAE